MVTSLSPLVAHHLHGIRTALALATSGAVRADVAMQHAAAELEKLAMVLAGGGAYAVEPVAREQAPGDLVVIEDTAWALPEQRSA